MAKFSWPFLCRYLLLFIWIPATLALEKNDYFYEITNNLQEKSKDFTLNLLDTVSRQKREMFLPPVISTTPTAHTVIDLKKNNSNSTTTAPPSSTTAPQLDFKSLPKKNLGENGAGIRKNYTIQSSSTAVTPSTTISTTTIITMPNNSKLNNTKINTTINKATNNTNKDKTNGDDDDSVEEIPNYLDTSKLNETLSKHNITITRSDMHLYYNSTFNTNPEVGKHYWINMTNRNDSVVNEALMKSYRKATTVKLSFDFPFYGHLIKNVTIATGGFLYTGEYVHSWLAATQYIAPLMANFDTGISKNSRIRYVDNGTAFTVEWEKVVLQDKPQEGEFTFQVTLLKNGDIIFVYENVPEFIEKIQEEMHPVKVGLSDAYIMDRTIFFVRRKTIYEYDRVHFDKQDIRNWTAIYLKALPTCLDSKSCTDCMTNKLDNFNCTWCPATNKCSTGFDRHRQEWIGKNCDLRKLTHHEMCEITEAKEKPRKYKEHITAYENHDSMEDKSVEMDSNVIAGSSQMVQRDGDTVRMGVSGIVAILFLAAMMCGLGFWVFYAYRNPHTASGQMLIRYRPTQWRWRRGEARYTAASIHM